MSTDRRVITLDADVWTHVATGPVVVTVLDRGAADCVMLVHDDGTGTDDVNALPIKVENGESFIEQEAVETWVKVPESGKNPPTWKRTIAG